MFGLEPWHIVLLVAVVLVVFGPKRLPEIGRSMGEPIREFRKATSELGDSVKAGLAEPTVAQPTPPPAAPQLPAISNAEPAASPTHVQPAPGELPGSHLP